MYIFAARNLNGHEKDIPTIKKKENQQARLQKQNGKCWWKKRD
jgi:hypothetical protein